MADATNSSAQLLGDESSPASYARLLPKIMAVEGTIHINVEVMYVVTLVLGHLKQIEALRDALSATLKDFDRNALDELDDCARALQHAHGLYLQATKSPVALQGLVDNATQLRDVLLTDATALAKRGLLNADSFREVKRNNGHRALIVDLQVLVATFRERWTEIVGRTAVQAEELDRAIVLVDTLTQAVGSKEHSPVAQAEATAIREKAFLLLVRTYNEIREGVLYVRRKHGDGELIAPSLYTGRGAGAKRGREQPDADESDGLNVATSAATEAQVPQSPAASLTANLSANGPFKRPLSEG